uniref:Uncharacterized protein n=1 Tax=viral metagenome TaxID=1070528 RepID=A0A2V0R9V1_9ZZZZ
MQNYELYFEQMDDFHTASYSYINLKMLSDASSRLEMLMERCGIPEQKTGLVKTILSFIAMEISAQDKGIPHYVDMKSLLCAILPQVDGGNNEMLVKGESLITNIVQEHYGVDFKVKYADTHVTVVSPTLMRIVEANRILHYVDNVNNVELQKVSLTLMAPSANGYQSLNIVSNGMFDTSANKITISLNAVIDDQLMHTLRHATMLEGLSVTNGANDAIAKRISDETSTTSFLIEGGSLQNDIIILHIFINDNGSAAVEQLRYILGKLLDYEEALLSSIKRAQTSESTVVTVMEGFGMRFPTNLISNMTRVVTELDRAMPSMSVVMSYVNSALRAYVAYHSGDGSIPYDLRKVLWFLGNDDSFRKNLVEFCEMLLRISVAEIDIRAMHTVGSPNDDNINDLDDALDYVAELSNDLSPEMIGSIRGHNAIEAMALEMELKNGNEEEVKQLIKEVTGSLEWIMFVSSDRFGEFV